MAESIADMMQRFTEQVMRHEYTLVGRLVAAYVNETGLFPFVCHDGAGTYRCERPTALVPVPESARQVVVGIAAEYREQTDIPASKAVLVREFRNLSITWRWEERK